MTTTPEVDDQGEKDNGKGILAKGESSSFVDTEVPKVNNPLGTEKVQDETISEINEPSTEFAGNAPVTPSDPPIKEGSNMEITRGESLV